MTTINETAAPGCTPKAARESSPRQPRSLEEPDTPRNSTAVVLIADARSRRARLLLAGELVPDQAAEARAWGDR